MNLDKSHNSQKPTIYNKKTHAKILSFSHLRTDESSENEINFKPVDLMEMVNLINSRKENNSKNELLNNKKSELCGLKCNIY